MRALGARLAEATPGLKLPRELVVANDGQIDPERVFTNREQVDAALGSWRGWLWEEPRERD